MGSNFAHDLAASGLELEASLRIHLTSNHYPPVPLSMVQPCIEAIAAIEEGESDRMIYLNGATYRGEADAPAWAIAEAHHLSAFITEED